MIEHRVQAEDLIPGNAEAILTFAGLDSAYLRRVGGPCPICGGRDRYRWKPVHEIGFCNKCRALSVIDIIKAIVPTDFRGACDIIRRWAGKTDAKPLPRQSAPTKSAWEMSHEDSERLKEKYQKLWRAGIKVQEDDPVHRYLHNRVPGLKDVPRVIRHHPGMDYWEENQDRVFVKKGTHPGMIAAVQAPDDRVCNIWRTFLTQEGTKAAYDDAKKAAGRFLAPGGAVRLFEPEGDELGIAEGIENALKAWTLYGIPTWPTLNANGMKTFILPKKYVGRIKRLRIFGDNDAPDMHGRRAGNDAAKALKERMAVDGVHAIIILPRGTSYDLADVQS